MIGTIRKHSQTLWWIIIAAIIITFVYWGSQPSRNDGGRRHGNYGSISGRPVSEKQFLQAYNETRLNFFFSSGGAWPEKDGKRFGFDLERETYYRLFMIQKQEELGIFAGADEVALNAKARLQQPQMRRMFQADSVSLDDFNLRVLKPNGLGLADFERLVKHDLGIQQLINVSGIGGDLVTPQEVQALYRREHEEAAVQAVFFSLSNYLSKVNVTADAVAQFYTNYMPEYKLPERVQVSYVKFPSSDFTNEVNLKMLADTNLAEKIEMAYKQLGSNFFSEAKSPMEAREKVREFLLNNDAMQRAFNKASAFATKLFNSNPPKAEQLAEFAREEKLTVLVSQPFSATEPSSDFEVGADALKNAFELTAEDPFGQPAVGRDGVYVFALDKRLPSENPPFDTISQRVTRDYKFVEAGMMARNEGAQFHSIATNGIATGKTFKAICEEAKVTPVLPTPFSLSTRTIDAIENHVTPDLFKRATFGTRPGNVSPFVPTAEGGFVVFVESRLPLDVAKMQSDLPRFTREVQQSRRGEAFQEWFRREAERALRDTPLARPQPGQIGSAAN